MMRFARAAMLPLIALACMAGYAEAFPKLSDPIVVPFRKYMLASNTTDPSFRLISGTAGAVDSSTTFWNSSAGQAALVADTTAWFGMPNFSVTNFPVYADSIPLLQAMLVPVTGNVVAASDSFQFTLQGSLDGLNVAMSAPAVDLLELGTSNTLGRLWNSTRLGAFNGVTATNVNMYGFPYYRLIVKDFTGTTGFFQMQIRYWQDVP